MKRDLGVVIGGSRGLGASIVAGLAAPGRSIVAASRSTPELPSDLPGCVTWVPCDLSNPEQSVRELWAAPQIDRIDWAVFNVGIWENGAFGEGYDFSRAPHNETRQIVETNILALILHAQSIMAHLVESGGRIVLIGSTWGEDNAAGVEVAFAASKFAMRGVAHSLRENLRSRMGSVTLINLGFMVSEYPVWEPVEQALAETNRAQIPVHDVVSLVRWILGLSPASCPKVVSFPAMDDRNL